MFKNLSFIIRGSTKQRLRSYAKSFADEQDSYWLRNKRLNRPTSPHLTVFKQPLAAKMSIAHRFTGATLSATLTMFGVGAFYFGGGNFNNFYQFVKKNLNSNVIQAIKFIISFAISYHTFNGMRHLVWDTGRGLKTAKTLRRSNYLIMALSITFAIALVNI